MHYHSPDEAGDFGVLHWLLERLARTYGPKRTKKLTKQFLKKYKQEHPIVAS